MEDQTERLKALWRIGRDKYTAFFATLEDVRREIGDEALSVYCWNELRIGLSVIMKYAELLRKVDAERVRAANAEAVKAERKQRFAKQEAERREREDLEMARAERAHRLAELKADTARLENRRDRERKQSPTESAQHQGARITAKLSEQSTEELIKRLRRAEGMEERPEPAYNIEGRVAKAQVVYAIRVKLGPNPDVVRWLAEDWLALIGLGKLDRKQLRKIFTENLGRSYPEIWESYKPTLTVVEAG
jgi:hypothetical protein